MLELKALLRRLNGIIDQMESDDMAYLPLYSVFIRERRAVKRMIRLFQRLERKR